MRRATRRSIQSRLLASGFLCFCLLSTVQVLLQHHRRRGGVETLLADAPVTLPQGEPALGLAARQAFVLQDDLQARQLRAARRPARARVRSVRSASRRGGAAGRRRWRRSARRLPRSAGVPPPPRGPRRRDRRGPRPFRPGARACPSGRSPRCRCAAARRPRPGSASVLERTIIRSGLQERLRHEALRPVRYTFSIATGSVSRPACGGTVAPQARVIESLPHGHRESIT